MLLTLNIQTEANAIYCANAEDDTFIKTIFYELSARLEEVYEGSVAPYKPRLGETCAVSHKEGEY